MLFIHFSAGIFSESKRLATTVRLIPKFKLTQDLSKNGMKYPFMPLKVLTRPDMALPYKLFCQIVFFMQLLKCLMFVLFINMEKLNKVQ